MILCCATGLRFAELVPPDQRAGSTQSCCLHCCTDAHNHHPGTLHQLLHQLLRQTPPTAPTIALYITTPPPTAPVHAPVSIRTLPAITADCMHQPPVDIVAPPINADPASKLQINQSIWFHLTLLTTACVLTVCILTVCLATHFTPPMHCCLRAI